MLYTLYTTSAILRDYCRLLGRIDYCSGQGLNFTWCKNYIHCQWLSAQNLYSYKETV